MFSSKFVFRSAKIPKTWNIKNQYYSDLIPSIKSIFIHCSVRTPDVPTDNSADNQTVQFPSIEILHHRI